MASQHSQAHMGQNHPHAGAQTKHTTQKEQWLNEQPQKQQTGELLLHRRNLSPPWTASPDWDKVVALLKATRRKAYLVTKMTPDKEAIRLHVKPHKLAKLGLEIRQEETFYVERATEQ